MSTSLTSKAPCLHCGGVHDDLARRCPTTGRALGGDPRLIGQLIDKRYRIVRLLGAGAFGSSYKAEHVTVGRAVALHVLPAAFLGSPVILHRFFGVARLMSSVANVRLHPLVDAGLSAEGVGYVAYAYVRGRSLASAIFREAPLPLEHAATIISDVLEGLAAIHRSGFVHRALAPESILLQASASGIERALITNFGSSALEIARFKKDPLGAARDAAFAPAVLVPPAYVPPERERDVVPDPREDIFAAGVMLAACLSPGGVPRFGSDLIAQKVPGAIEAIIAKATSTHPLARFESAIEMRACLVPYAHVDSEEPASATKTHISDLRALSRRERTTSKTFGAARLEGPILAPPVFLDGPMAHALMGALAHAAGAGWREIAERVPDARDALASRPGASLPLRILTAALEEADAIVGTRDRLFCWVVGQHAADTLWGGLAAEHGPLTPELFFDQGVVPLATRLGGGSCRATNIGRGYGRLEVKDRREPSLAMCSVMTGIIGALLLRLGARDVELNKTACEATGDPSCIFTATWT